MSLVSHSYCILLLFLMPFYCIYFFLFHRLLSLFAHHTKNCTNSSHFALGVRMDEVMDGSERSLCLQVGGAGSIFSDNLI